MNSQECAEYAERVCNNAADMIRQFTTNPGGETRNLSGEVAAGVLTAQSNLAIAAALMRVADAIKEAGTR